MSIGYSFNDDFGKNLLEKFDSYNYRDKRWIINVDPYPNPATYSYYYKNNICILRTSFEHFFKLYKEWEEKNTSLIVKKKGLSITNSRDSQIAIPNKLLLSIDGTIRQLNQHTKNLFIKDEEYYRGNEPNFDIIVRNLDVIKSKTIEKSITDVKKILDNEGNTFVPLVFITGDFGIGKSTFALRLIYELEKDSNLDVVAFEILDLNKVRKEHLIELIKHVKASLTIFYCDEIEIESFFKALLEIQREISIEQFQDCRILFLAPIRENILEKYKLNRSYIPNSTELKISGKFEDDEIDDLLEKLKRVDLVSFRDANEKRLLKSKIKKEYDSDSFIALMSSITSGKHERDLMDCYEQLSKETQEAFLYTALLHKHKLFMPAGWLKQNIKMNWDEFSNKVIKAEGKGILIQVSTDSKGSQPDLYFKTKHPLIAEKLIAICVSSKDKQYKMYEQILKQTLVGQSNSYIVNNLLRALSRSEEFNETQINNLYDVAYTRFSDDPYFLLNYAINLQSRKTKTSLKKAIDHLLYAESLFERRNHKFIHRRAVINFDLAKICLSEGSIMQSKLCMKEASELFVLKQLLDPFSAFSYIEYIKFLIWQLQENIFSDAEDRAQTQILIEELFDSANKAVTDELDKINSLRSVYANYLTSIIDNSSYEEYLVNMYNEWKLRPYACILLYDYYNERSEFDECTNLLEEMESLTDNYEIVKFLFKLYGSFLHIANVRKKFFELAKKNPQLEKVIPLKYYYFMFVAETYNHNYSEGRLYLENIETKYHNLNPEFNQEWKDSDGEVQIFNAKIVQNKGEKYKAAKILSNQLTVRLLKGNYEKYKIGDNVNIKLNFFLYGLIAEIDK